MKWICIVRRRPSTTPLARARRAMMNVLPLPDVVTHTSDSLQPMRDAELRALAVTSGLADPREPVAEITQVGRTFDALLRAAQDEPVRHHRGPIGHLRRLLAPSA